MKRAVIFVSLLSLCLSACKKEQETTIYGKWLRTSMTQYNSATDFVWVDDWPNYPFILEFKGNNTCYIHEDTGPDPQGSFHLDVRKMALIFDESTRIFSYYWNNNHDIQIIEITSDFLWIKNNAGFQAKFKRYYL